MEGFSKKSDTAAFIGSFLVIPALLVPLAGVLNLGASNPLIHPVLVMGGLFVAFTLNSAAVLRVRVKPVEGVSVGFTMLDGRKLNVLLLFVSLLMASVLTVYVFTENFRIVVR